MIVLADQFSLAKLMADKAIERTEAAKDQEHRAKGEVMECGCCFDIVTIHKVTHCNGEEAHFFCLDCARANAENDIGKSRYELRCMDSSGCRASFSRLERQRFLDAKSIETLERLQQQDEIRLADLQNLSTCPFCDFAAICPPIEVDKEFRCHNPECEEVSCRLCKLKSHIPLSCDEFKKEHGVSERRVIEEARTEALIRTCGKCKVRILKEDGCNKVICTKCYAVLCDYCGKDITKTLYNHFDGQGRAPPGLITGSGGKCPLYDESHKRKDQQVEAAGREAMDKVRSEHPDLSEQDLKIKFAMDVQSPTNGRHRDYDYDFHPLNGAFPPHYMRHWDGLDAAAPNYIAGQQQPDDGDDDLFYIGNVRAAANDGNDARPAGPRGEYVQHLMNERHQRLREQAQQLLQQQQQLFHQQYHQARQQVQRHQQQRHLELAEIQRNLAESQRQRDTLQAHRVRMNAMAHNMQRDPLRPRENDLAFNADYNRNGLNIQARARETNEVFQRLAGARALPGERPTNPSSSPVTPLRARHQPNGRNAFDLHPWLATSNDP